MNKQDDKAVQDLLSLGGRLAFGLECLLLDTKDIAVVSKWWAISNEALNAWREHLWEISHGNAEDAQ